ncbi:MAG TPA: hypothetical protein VGE95_21580 [Arthrobacter sp.]
MADTFTSTDHDWVDAGQQITSYPEMFEYLSQVLSAVRNMRTGIQRATHGTLTGRAWINDFPIGEDSDVELNMTVTPPGMTAKDAMYRQAIDTLLAALDTVDRAALGAWLADVNRLDPNRTA